jgi:MFS family permease
VPDLLEARRRADAVSPGGFYGWRIVALAAVALAMSAPGQTVGVSVFVDHLITDLGLSRSLVSTAYLIGTLAGAVLLPVVGRRIDRRGIRRTMTAIGVAFGAVLVAMAGVAGFVTLAVGFAGIRLLGQGSLTLTATTSVALWFDRRRGTAIGLTTATGQGLMSLSPLALVALVGAVGWRWTWVVAGVLVWAIVVPAAAVGMRDRPADLGQRPDGDADPQRDDEHRPATPAWTRTEAVRTLMFWAITAAVAVTGMVGTGLAFHQISILGERGLTPAQAAAVFVPQTLATIAATFLMGWLVDRLPIRVLVGAAMATLLAAMLVVQHVTPGWTTLLYALSAGGAGGALRALEAAGLPRLYGTRHIGALRGLVMALMVAATAFGPFMLAIGFERFGSYGRGLDLLAVLPVAVTVLAIVAKVPDAARLEEVRRRHPLRR